MVKVYENIKKFIKENYKFLIVYIVVLIICLWPLPYYIYTGGGTINLDNRISIENEYVEKGSFNLAYVKNIKATIPTYLLSYVFDWDVESIEDYQIDSNESKSDIWKRERLYLQESIDNAIINAYRVANEDLVINKEVYKVLSIDEYAKTNLLIDDVILEIDVDGALKIKQNYNEAILIFIKPKTMEELENRLRSRKSDSEEKIKERLEKAIYEIKKSIYYDYVVESTTRDEDYEKILNIVLKKVEN